MSNSATNPYQAPETNLDPGLPHGPSHGERYATFWERLVAAIVDTICLLALTSLCGFLVYGADYWLDSSFVQGPADILISYVLPFALHCYFWVRHGATPGKMVMGIRIINQEGANLSIGRAIIRYIGLFVSTIALLLGYLWMLWDPQNRTWHDMMARSSVVKTRKDIPTSS